MKLIKTVVPAFIVLILVISACAVAVTQPAVSAKQVDIHLANHLAFGMPEQDVYAEVKAGSDQVKRIIPDEQAAYQDAPAYASSVMIAHDPLQLNEGTVGPYDKGASLGFSMGEWLAASADGTYTVAGDQAEIDLAFQNLVPNGVYTVWCSRLFMPPNFKIIDIPCGNPDGSDSAFAANADGSADFQVTMVALPDSTAEMVSVIAVAYHSDGQTYDNLPGDFGLNSHVQIFTMLPGPEDAAWQTVNTNSPIAKK